MKPLIFIVILIIVLTTLSYGDDLSVVLDKKVATFSVISATLPETVYKLIEEQKVRICIEEIPYSEQEYNKILDRLARTPGEMKYAKDYVYFRSNITVNLKDVTVKDILDAIVGSNPQYTWDTGEEQIINIIPSNLHVQSKNQSVLNWAVPTFSFPSSTIGRIVLMHDLDISEKKSFGEMLNQHHITTSIGGGVLDAVRQTQTIKLEHPVSAREFLNKLVKGAGDGVFWHLYNIDTTDRRLTFGQAF